MLNEYYLPACAESYNKTRLYFCELEVLDSGGTT